MNQKVLTKEDSISQLIKLQSNKGQTDVGHHQEWKVWLVATRPAFLITLQRSDLLRHLGFVCF